MGNFLFLNSVLINYFRFNLPLSTFKDRNEVWLIISLTNITLFKPQYSWIYDWSLFAIGYVHLIILFKRFSKLFLRHPRWTWYIWFSWVFVIQYRFIIWVLTLVGLYIALLFPYGVQFCLLSERLQHTAYNVAYISKGVYWLTFLLLIHIFNPYL